MFSFFIYSSESSDSDYDEDIEIPEFERIDREIVDGEIVFVVDKNEFDIYDTVIKKKKKCIQFVTLITQKITVWLNH